MKLVLGKPSWFEVFIEVRQLKKMLRQFIHRTPEPKAKRRASALFEMP